METASKPKVGGYEMLASIKEALAIYKRNFWRVLLIGLTIILPIQLIYTIVVNFVSLPLAFFNIPLWSNLFQGIFMIMSLFLILIPLISLVVQETRTQKVNTGKIYVDMLRYSFFLYVISIPVSILTTIGFFLLIIPGLVLLIFSMGMPFVKVTEDDSLKGVLKKSIAFGKEHFMNICGLLLLFAAVDFLASFLLTYLAIGLTGLMAITNWALMVLNMFLLPVFVFTVAKLYLDWNGEADLVHEDAYFQQLKQYQ
jgi:hypothetical protein